MDPTTILAGFAKVTLAIKEQYDTLSNLQDAKAETLRTFKQASSNLGEDLVIYETLFSTCIKHGDSAALSRLLRSGEGTAAFWTLRDALDYAHERLTRLESTVPRLAEASNARSRSQSILAPLVLAIPAQKAKDRIELATKEVLDQHARITRAYKSFYSLYRLHDKQPKPPSTRTPFPRSSGDVVLQLFQRQPFHVTSSTHVDDLCNLNAHQHAAIKHRTAMTEEGKAWVELQIEEETVQVLGDIQTRLMELLRTSSLEQMKSDRLNFSFGSGQERKNLEDQIESLELGLKTAIARAKSPHFSIAFCGMVKAGKSLFLNALMGRIILPSDELPSTAWPCRLRHVSGQTQPSLEFNPGPFRKGLAQLRARKYATKLASYTPPSDNLFADILDETPAATCTPADDLRDVYSRWIDLNPCTRANLLRFEDPKFKLPSRAKGGEAVSKLLGELNDIVRLCHRFQLGFPTGNEWPLLSVEFDSLREKKVEGIFEFIDLPGLGEGFDQFDFEDLIRQVAQEANAVVPIISFKEIPKEDWKQLPEIMNAGLGARTNMVICTHFDQVSSQNLPEQRANIGKVFWPQGRPPTSQIVPCSSRMGLSAYTLLRRSQEHLPPLSSFWSDSEKNIEYFCAEKILGVGNTEENYASFNLAKWRSAVERQLKSSGLTGALHHLTTNMVTQARQRALILEGDQLFRRIHKVVISQRQVLPRSDLGNQVSRLR